MNTGLRDFVKSWGPTITLVIFCFGFFFELSAKLAEWGNSYIVELHTTKNMADQTAKDLANYKEDARVRRDKRDEWDKAQDKEIGKLQYDVTRLMTINRITYTPPIKTEE